MVSVVDDHDDQFRQASIFVPIPQGCWPGATPPKNPGVLKPLSKDDFPLVVITHNDIRLMASFFRHYRSMGVTRFFCLDDASTDGTQDFVLDQPDADLFTSNVRYKDADRGKIWREKLSNILRHNRWYLTVHLDEYFLYESISRETIGEYTRRLDVSRRESRAGADARSLSGGRRLTRRLFRSEWRDAVGSRNAFRRRRLYGECLQNGHQYLRRRQGACLQFTRRTR